MVAADRAEASEAVKSCLRGLVKQAPLVIEEFRRYGAELHRPVDETGIVPLASSQITSASVMGHGPNTADGRRRRCATRR